MRAVSEVALSAGALAATVVGLVSLAVADAAIRQRFKKGS